MTVSALLVLWGVGWATGSVRYGPPAELAQRFGLSIGQPGAVRWWSPLSSMLWCSGLPAYLLATALLLVVLPAVERRLGGLRALPLLVVVQLLGTVFALALVGVIGPGRWAGQVTTAVVSGPVPALAGAALAATAWLGTLWRRRLRLVMLICLVMLALYSGLPTDLLRLGAGLAGLVVGAVAVGRGPRVRNGFSTPELRTLVALVVAASAVGPLIAAFADTHTGPLSVLRFVFATPPPSPGEVARICVDPAAARDCAHLRARLRLYGVGPATMSIMPILVLLVAAEGLRRGRRAAWLIAVVLNLALFALGVLFAWLTVRGPARERLIAGPDHHLHGALEFALPVAQPLLIVALLAVTLRHFGVRAPAGTYRRWIMSAARTFCVVSALYLGAGAALANGFEPAPTLPGLLADLPTRFLPPDYLGAVEADFLPVWPVTTLLFEWTGIVFWAVVLAGAVSAFARISAAPERDVSARVRALLARGGPATQSYPATWPGNSYWFTADGSAVMAYRVIAGVAITTGGPIGEKHHHRDAIAGFVDYCQRNSWTPCLYGIGADAATHAAGLGWHIAQVAEEAIVPLRNLKFTGKKWQSVRTAMNHAARGGITARWYRFRHAPPEITGQIRVLSREWVAHKGLPEMRFTLGGLNELADDDVRLLLAIDEQGRVHAATSWLPVRQDGAVVGYTLDFMRRRQDAPSGVVEFLIASAARDCRDDGLEFLSLSGAPLARVGRDTRTTGLQRALDTVGRTLEPLYGFASLLAFKAKFQPSYRPLYMAYPDPLALPAIGTAITRAYLPELTVRDVRQIGRAMLVAMLSRPRPMSRPMSRPLGVASPGREQSELAGGPGQHRP
ncbi:MAG: DUF2156 domain-containing protein [Pseudonocardia sp.]|nr:DUF2156 domain-containing protein [Pseudonocardia sp.]